jgi:rare lipoprotein A
LQGQRTATGSRFDSRKLTAASSRLPLNSRAVVTNLKNGRSVMVKVNDCGPAKQGRQIDLSKQAARKVGMLHQGVAPVKVRIIDKPRNPRYCSKAEDGQR